MKKIVIAVVIILALILVINVFSNNNSNNEGNENVETSVNENVENNGDDQTVEEAGEGELAGTYTQYNDNLEQYEGKDIVLFFKADWCPSCRVLDADIKESLSDIPEDVVLLELNYDTETDLKKKYGVTTQHTMVQVDTSGDMIKKWSGGNRLEDVLNQIN